jgi:hypothetical protein
VQAEDAKQDSKKERSRHKEQRKRVGYFDLVARFLLQFNFFMV